MCPSALTDDDSEVRFGYVVLLYLVEYFELRSVFWNCKLQNLRDDVGILSPNFDDCRQLFTQYVINLCEFIVSEMKHVVVKYDVCGLSFV